MWEVRIDVQWRRYTTIYTLVQTLATIEVAVIVLDGFRTTRLLSPISSKIGRFLDMVLVRHLGHGSLSPVAICFFRNRFFGEALNSKIEEPYGETSK